MRSLAEVARVVQAWRRLEEADLHPVLIKGWSIARLYPELGVRPLGDVDLAFSSAEIPAAIRVREQHLADFILNDFHDGLPDLPDRTWDEVYARTRQVPLEGCLIRVLGWEDHLRLTCRHLVRHGLRTPLKLCDVAVILESLPDDFDWDECLRGDPHDTRWLLAVLGLAHDLLGAEIRDPQVRAQALRVPQWLKDLVPRVWEAGHDRHPLGYYLRRPREGWLALRYRYLNPIRASLYTGTLPRNRVHVALTVLRYFAVCRASTIVTHPLRRLLVGRRTFADDPVHRDLGA